MMEKIKHWKYPPDAIRGLPVLVCAPGPGLVPVPLDPVNVNTCQFTWTVHRATVVVDDKS